MIGKIECHTDQEQQVPPALPTDGFFGSTMQPQEAFCLFSIPLITAAAHPTPASTDTAPKGQLRLQAPHSMQASRFLIRTRFSSIAITSWGQTSKHMPQPVHLSVSTLKVTTSFR
jgi:hypothetical protein